MDLTTIIAAVATLTGLIVAVTALIRVLRPEKKTSPPTVVIFKDCHFSGHSLPRLPEERD
jgi:hypothetical protein